MATNKNQKRLSTLLGILAFLVIGISGYLTIGDIAGQQSQEHQQSISPVFALIEEELIEPLNVAETLADAGVYDEYFTAENPDSASLMKQLSEYHQKFGYEFYLAHEKSRKQYNSDGRVFDLIEGKVIWYFALKNDTSSKVQAVLGKREDVHLYTDVRQYDADGNFIGFVGVGKSLKSFITSFNDFRAKYGHEFLFVNNEDEVVLSSLRKYAPEEAATDDGRIDIKFMQDIDWYQEFIESASDEVEPSVVVDTREGDLLVSKINLNSLNWKLYILTPLNVRQQAVNESFTIHIAVGVVISIILLKVLSYLFDKYMNKVSRRINRDPLTKLANREYGRFYFNRMRKKYRQVSVIVCDLDHFKSINDNLGHMAGDYVIDFVAKAFSSNIKREDLVVRWGGEEFVFILPDTTLEQAQVLAERCRTSLEDADIVFKQQPIHVTGSFGLFSSRQYSDTLDVMVEKADRAMYRSKKNGRNQVCVMTNDVIELAS